MLANAVEPRSDVIYVQPGQLTVTTEPVRLRTILGSCVSVCLYDPGRRIGGMNHFMLPKAPERYADSARYGDVAMSRLLERMLRVGADQHVLCAQVCGGARVLGGMSDAAHLGRNNAEFAFAWLDEQRIPVMRSEVLGNAARRLVFDVSCGSALIEVIGT